MYSLMILILLTTGRWDSESIVFPDKEACAKVRTLAVRDARQQKHLTLISNCATGGEVAIYHAYSNVGDEKK